MVLDDIVHRCLVFSVPVINAWNQNGLSHKGLINQLITAELRYSEDDDDGDETA